MHALVMFVVRCAYITVIQFLAHANQYPSLLCSWMGLICAMTGSPRRRGGLASSYRKTRFISLRTPVVIDFLNVRSTKSLTLQACSVY